MFIFHRRYPVLQSTVLLEPADTAALERWNIAGGEHCNIVVLEHHSIAVLGPRNIAVLEQRNIVVLDSWNTLVLGPVLEYSDTLDGEHLCTAVLEHWNKTVWEHCCRPAEEYLCTPVLELGWRQCHTAVLVLRNIAVLEHLCIVLLAHSGTLLLVHWNTAVWEHWCRLDEECCYRPPLLLFLAPGYTAEMVRSDTLVLEQSCTPVLGQNCILLWQPVLGWSGTLVLEH